MQTEVSRSAMLVLLAIASTGALAADTAPAAGGEAGGDVQTAGQAAVVPRPKAAATNASVTVLDLPEPIAPRELAQRLTDLPGSMQVVDIRPAWQYEEFHIDGATNAVPADVLNGSAYLAGPAPLVLVSRDGALAAALGGAIAAKTERSIRYLDGGMVRYWNELMLPAGLIGDQAIGVAPGPAPAPTATEPATLPAPAPPRKPPSAGC